MSTKHLLVFLLMNMIATQTLAREWCAGLYDSETGKATLPCVDDPRSGQRYWVELTRKEGFDFSVSEVSKEYKRMNANADILNIKLLKRIKFPNDGWWMFLELNVIPGCGNSSQFIVTDTPSGNNHGRIDIKVTGSFCPNPSWDTGHAIAGIVEVSQGIYDVYVNGELKKTTEVPPPDNQSP